MQLDDTKAVLNSIPSPVAVLDADGTIVQVNEAWSVFAQDNGGPETLANGVGTNYLEVCQSADGPWADEAPVAQQGIRAVLNGELTTFDLEYPCHSPDEQHWFLMTVSPLKGARGGVVISHVDITERKLAEVRRAGFDRILESSLNEIYIFDADTLRFIEVNEGARRNLGYTREELTTMTPVDIKPDHTVETFAVLVSPLLDGKDKIDFYTVHRRKDGSDYPVEVHLQRMMYDDRQVYVAIIHDITERQRAEERVTGLGNVLEASINEIMMFDDETLHFVHANHGARNNLGYSMEELLQLTPLDIKPEFTRESFEAILAPLRSSEKKIVDFTTVHQRKDGSTYPVELHLQRSMLDGKSVIAQIILDITERTQTEEALSQSRLFLESAPDATIIVNSEGRIEVANSQTVHLLGYTPDELRGMSVDALVPERFREDHFRHRDEYAGNPKVRSMGAGLDLFAVTKDGREIPIEVSLSPIKTSDGVLVAAAIRDISDRKLAEHAMRESEARYRQLFENAGDLIQSVNPDGSFVYVNPAWRKTLGYSEEEVASLTMFEVIHPDDHAHCRAIFGRILAGQTVDRIQTQFVTKDGGVVLVEGNASCQFEDGTPISTRAIFHDVTQRVAAERSLAEAKELAESATATKSRFLAAASHDLRQPLQSIGIYLSVLNRRLESAETVEISEKIRNSLDVMGELLDALLDISKLDSGSVTPSKRDFSIQTMFDQMLASSGPHASEKGLVFRCEASSCVVHSDPALLQRVVENFVSNAIRYTDSGNVDVRCKVHDDLARIEVQDTGVGIPEEAIETIFEEYFQLDNPVRDRRKGLGLGLSIVRHIARLLGHSLSVESVPGEGSIFSVEVPLGQPAEQPADVHVQAKDSVRSVQEPVVLFVDDDPAIVDATTMLLSVSGFQVHSALNGDDALAHLANGLRPDIVVSDYRLPGFSGVEVIRRVRDATVADLPTVLMTGDTSAHEIEAADLSHCTVLHKPVDTDQLISLMQTLTA